MEAQSLNHWTAREVAMVECLIHPSQWLSWSVGTLRSSDRATAAGTRSLHVYSCGADCVTGQALGPGQTIPLPEGGTHGGPDPELKFTWGETKAQEGRQLGQSFAAQGRPKVHRYPRINSHEPDTHLPLPSWGYSLSHCPSLAPAWVLSVGQGLGSCELKRAS